MADAVSKLYAEIGFKINQQELNNAKAYIRDIAKQLSDFNKQAQVAAEKAGFFSKKQIQQQRAQNREIEHQNKLKISEQLKQNREQEKLYKEITDIENKEYKEQLRQADIQERERQKRREETLRNLKEFGKSFWKLSEWIASKAGQAIGESVGRNTELSKLQMFTGINIGDYQSFAERASSTGSGMTQFDVMRDIQNVSANLQKIALGQGSLSGYKLMHVVAQAQQGSVGGVIREFEKALKTIEPNMALEVGQQIGLSRDWIYSLFESQREGEQIKLSQEQKDEIKETGKAFSQVRYALENFKDFVTATLSPALRAGADLIRDTLKDISIYIDENYELFSKRIKDFAEAISSFIKDFVEGRFDRIFERLEKASMGFIALGEKLYSAFAPAPDTDNKKVAWDYIMHDKRPEDDPWNWSKKNPVSAGSKVESTQNNDIKVTVESKTNNPYEEGREIGRGIVSATQEKASYNNNSSTLVAGAY